MPSSATTVAKYLDSLPADRRDAISRVRDVINRKLPRGFDEKMQWGMITWCVPESVLPAREVYNKQPLCLAGLVSQKRHMAVYLMAVYGDPKERAWFEAAYKKSGKRLDMGQSCVRFSSLEALPLDVVGEAVSRVDVDRYVAAYHRLRGATQRTKPAPKAKPAAAGNSKQRTAAPAKRGSAKRGATRPAKRTRAAR